MTTSSRSVPDHDMARTEARSPKRDLPGQLLDLAEAQRSALTSAQIRAVLTERRFRRALQDGEIVKLWRGAYAIIPVSDGGPSNASQRKPRISDRSGPNRVDDPRPPRRVVAGTERWQDGSPSTMTSRLRPEPRSIPVATRLAAAELTLGRRVTACLDTAAELYGFSTSNRRIAQRSSNSLGSSPRPGSSNSPGTPIEQGSTKPKSSSNSLTVSTHVLGDTRSTLGALSVHRTPPVRPLRLARFNVVDPAETAVRLAAGAANPPRALAVLDAALRCQATTRESLASVASELHLTRIGLVRSLITLADPRAESPPESWLRWVCHDAGFPPPEPQLWVECEQGVWFRLDLGWPEFKLGLEYDGVEFHTGRALTNDRGRRNALTAHGWTMLSVTAPMLWAGRERLVQQLALELQRRGSRLPS